VIVFAAITLTPRRTPAVRGQEGIRIVVGHHAFDGDDAGTAIRAAVQVAVDVVAIPVEGHVEGPPVVAGLDDEHAGHHAACATTEAYPAR
jgi:hypothetical protein